MTTEHRAYLKTLKRALRAARQEMEMEMKYIATYDERRVRGAKRAVDSLQALYDKQGGSP